MKPLLCALLIYPTVCVEFVAKPGVVYNLYYSKNMVDWEVHPHYKDYVTDKVETNRMWRGRGEANGFFRLETNEVTDVAL